MRRSWRLALVAGTLLTAAMGSAAAYVFVLGDPLDLLADPRYANGVVVDSHNGVSVYDHGPIVARSHGRHYAKDGTYFGQRWQCVEYVKRYLY